MVRRSAIRVCLCAVLLLPLCLVAPSRGDWATGGTTGIEGAKCTEGVNSCSTCMAGYWRTSNDDVCTVQKCNDSNFTKLKTCVAQNRAYSFFCIQNDNVTIIGRPCTNCHYWYCTRITNANACVIWNGSVQQCKCEGEGGSPAYNWDEIQLCVDDELDPPPYPRMGAASN